MTRWRGGAPSVRVRRLAGPHPRSTGRRPVLRAGTLPEKPLRYALVATLGVGLGLALLSAITTLSTVLVYIGLSLFIAIAFEPAIRWAAQRSFPRWAATLTYSLLFLLVCAGITTAVIPSATEQVTVLTRAVVDLVADIPQQPWFIWLSDTVGDGFDMHGLLDSVSALIANPDQIIAFGGGILKVGSGIVDGVTGVIVTTVLTLYFSATLPRITDKALLLVPRSRRTHVGEITEEILQSVGRYVAGQILLAFVNAAFTLALTSILGSPAPLLLAVVAFIGALIPMVGPLIGSTIAVLATLSVSPTAALVAGVVLLVYMQVEAYFLTPRVMARAVSVPGPLVIIAALAGATLGGVLGALVAVPIAAAGLLLIERIVVPRQEKA